MQGAISRLVAGIIGPTNGPSNGPTPPLNQGAALWSEGNRFNFDLHAMSRRVLAARSSCSSDIFVPSPNQATTVQIGSRRNSTSSISSTSTTSTTCSISSVSSTSTMSTTCSISDEAGTPRKSILKKERSPSNPNRRFDVTFSEQIEIHPLKPEDRTPLPDSSKTLSFQKQDIAMNRARLNQGLRSRLYARLNQMGKMSEEGNKLFEKFEQDRMAGATAGANDSSLPDNPPCGTTAPEPNPGKSPGASSPPPLATRTVFFKRMANGDLVANNKARVKASTRL